MISNRRLRSALVGVLILPALLVTNPVVATAKASHANATGGSGAGSKSTCDRVPKFQRDDFPKSPKINNKFLPLSPGTQVDLDGFVIDGSGTKHPHRIETTVTDLTKVIDGVRTIVVFDVDLQDGVVVESEIFFVAQDESGRVWTFGEYPEEYDQGQLTGAPKTWLSGVHGAHAGIAMLALPRVGTPTYLQGLAPEVGFQDCGTVFKTGQRTCIPLRCYDGVLVIDEFAPLDPTGGHQRKFYAPGLGVIKVAAAGGVDPEALQLTRATELCPSAFAHVSKQALDQDGRGYDVAPAVYGGTPHAKRTLHADRC
jgi:hypothetical protein